MKKGLGLLIFLTLFIFTNNSVHAARKSFDLRRLLPKNLPTRITKGFTFFDGTLLSGSGAVGSVYRVRHPRPNSDRPEENWMIFKKPYDPSKTLTDEQWEEIKYAWGYATVDDFWQKYEVEKEAATNFGIEVVVPELGTMISGGGNLNVTNIKSSTIWINQLHRRRLDTEKFNRYVEGLSDNSLLKKIYKEKKVVLVAEDYMIRGMMISICSGNEFSLGLRAELLGLEIAQLAIGEVTRVHSSDTPAPTIGQLVAEMREKADARLNDPSTPLVPGTKEATYKYLEKFGGSTVSGGSGPGFGMVLQHVDANCFSAITNNPAILGNKIVEQKKIDQPMVIMRGGRRLNKRDFEWVVVEPLL